MGNPDLSHEDRRGLVIFPGDTAPRPAGAAGEWWLVPLALLLTAAMIAIAFAIR